MTETKTIAPTTQVAGTARSGKPLGVGILPTTIGEVKLLADYLQKSEMVPKDYRGKPENCIAAILMGTRLGLDPMQSLRSICVINGRASLFGDGMLAVVMSHRDFQGIRETFEPEAGELAKLTAVCKVLRRGVGEVVRSFSWEDAVKAGLDKKPGPWKEYPKRMLQMRARGFACRDAFPDALSGMETAEEMMDRQPPTVINPEGESYDPADELASRSDEFRQGAEDVQQPALPAVTEATGQTSLVNGLPDSAMDDIENKLADLAVQTKGSPAAKSAAVTGYFKANIAEWEKVCSEAQLVKLAASRDSVLDELKAQK